MKCLITGLMIGSFIFSAHAEVPQVVEKDSDGDIVRIAAVNHYFNFSGGKLLYFLENWFPTGIGGNIDWNSAFSSDFRSRGELGGLPRKDVSLKDFNRYPKLKFLAVRQGSRVSAADAVLPDLEYLALENCSADDLSRLQAPKLKTLFLSGLRRAQPTAGKMSLPGNLKQLEAMNLDNVSTGDFDYTALAEAKTLHRISLMNFDGRDLDFLRGLPIEHLVLSVDTVTPAMAEVIRGLPLKTLELAVRKRGDLGFLSGMPLQQLTLFAPPTADLPPLSGMKLKKLIFGGGREADLGKLPLDGLESLYLTAVTIRNPGALATSSLQRLALINVVCGDDGKLLTTLSGMKSLRGLNVSGIFTPGTDGGKNAVKPDELLVLKKLVGLEECVLIGANDLELCRDMKRLRKLKFHPGANTRGELDLAPLAGRKLETLDVPIPERQLKAQMKKYGIMVKSTPSVAAVTDR